MGFAAGLLAGTRAGLDMIRAYDNSRENVRRDMLNKRADDDWETTRGMNRVAAEAAQGGFDANGVMVEADKGGPGDLEGQNTTNAAMGFVTRKDQRKPEQRILDGFAAAEQFALSKGRYDLALDAHIKSEAEADKYREKDLAESLDTYAKTKDPNALLSHVKRFVRDGMDFDPVQIVPGPAATNADGTVVQGQERFIVKGRGPDGKAFTSDPMTRAEFENYAAEYTNPQRARAAAVARAADLRKAQLQVIVERAKRDPKEMTPGKRIINPDGSDGGMVPGTVYEKIKGEDGMERLFAITYGKGGETGRADITGQANTLQGFDKKEHERYKDASTAINQHLDREMAQGVGSPEIGALQQQAYAVASNLIAANRGNTVSLEGGNVADLALKVARGQIKPEPLSVRDKSGTEIGKADGFIVDGKPVYVNPQQVRMIEGRIAQSNSAVAGAPNVSERPVNFGGQSPRPGMARVATGDRSKLLGQELQTEKATLAELESMSEADYRAKYGTNAEPREVRIQRARDNISALGREGAPVPEAAPAPAPQAVPAAAPPRAAAPVQVASVATPTLGAAKQAGRLAEAVNEMRSATAELAVAKASSPGGRATAQAKQAREANIQRLQKVVDDRMNEIATLRAGAKPKTNLAMTE